MGVHRTCGGPDETKKNTHPKYTTALLGEQVPAVAAAPLPPPRRTQAQLAEDEAVYSALMREATGLLTASLDHLGFVEVYCTARARCGVLNFQDAVLLLRLCHTIVAGSSPAGNGILQDGTPHARIRQALRDRGWLLPDVRAVSRSVSPP